jgi:hypothetical protein
MVRNKDTALKADRTLDTQELHPLISLNMVVCLNNQDLNQPDRWLTSSLQASFLVSKAGMEVLQPSHPDNILTSRWVTEDLLALVAMAVALSRLQTPNGVPLQPKALEMVLVAIRDNSRAVHDTSARHLRSCTCSVDFSGLMEECGISIQAA